jgi:phosphatidylglycerophosphate synthase
VDGSAMKKLGDTLARPLVRVLRERLGLSPGQVTWAAFWLSAAAAVAIADRRVTAGLVLMALGQILDGLDGAMARQYQLASEEGHRLDTWLDRASEILIFFAFAIAELVPLGHALLAIAAVVLLTTVCDRSGLDPGMKRFALYFGAWIPYSTLFAAIFGVNLAAYVVGLLIIDCQFQVRMDQLGGDLDTVASRAAAGEKSYQLSAISYQSSEKPAPEPVPAFNPGTPATDS